MSRSGTRDTNTVPTCKVPVFVKLMDTMAEWLGSENAAYAACGVNGGHWWYIKQNHKGLSMTMAKKVLATYKAEKAKRCR